MFCLKGRRGSLRGLLSTPLPPNSRSPCFVKEGFQGVGLGRPKLPAASAAPSGGLTGHACRSRVRSTGQGGTDMEWYAYLAYFAAGALVANGVPHFVNGISGKAVSEPVCLAAGGRRVAAAGQRSLGAGQLRRRLCPRVRRGLLPLRLEQRRSDAGFGCAGCLSTPGRVFRARAKGLTHDPGSTP